MRGIAWICGLRVDMWNVEYVESRGCADVRMCGCVDVWMCGYVDV